MERVLELLKESDALLEGHFLLSSGKHSNRYVQCAKLLMYPKKSEEVCEIIDKKLKEMNIEVDCVVGPAMGGVIIAYEMGRKLGVRAMFTERENEIMTLRRGFFVNEGERVLIVEDVVTTGKSSLEAIKAVEEKGAVVVAIASLVDRTNGKELPLPLASSIKLEISTYDKENCPLCKENKIELIKPGSRKVFK